MSDAFLARYGGRPFLVAVASLNLITGLAGAAVLAPLSFGADVDFLRRGAQGLLDGVAVLDFVFTPLAAAISIPLAVLPPDAAAVVMLLVSLAVLLVGVAVETRTLAPLDRVLVAVAVGFSLPVVNELLLGQVTLLIAAAVYPVRDRDALTRGIPLGVALALVPKPLLLPLLVWMLVWRRRSLAGALLTALVLTALGVLVLGIDRYQDWLEALRGAGEVTRRGNFSVWTDGIAPLSIALAVAVVTAFVLALRRPASGFVAALPAGVLLAPYSLLYALSILVLAVRPALSLAPRAARILLLVVNPVVVALPLLWAAGWLVIPFVDHREPEPDG